MILIADDHPVFRSGMSQLLAQVAPNVELMQAGTMHEVLEAIALHGAPTLLILDLLFPGLNLALSLPALRRNIPKTSIIVVSMLDDGATIDRVMKAGADAYIVKSISAQEMLDAIRAVQAGQFVIARPKDGGLADSHYPPLEIDDVTGRQQQVLALLVNGKTNKEIARALSISPLTVRNHVSILLKAFKVRSRWQLKAKASLQDASSELP